MNIRFNNLHVENFKGFKQFDISFGARTTNVSGCNGIGKSTIAEALMWVLHGCGNDLTNNPKVRREVDGAPVNDVPVIAELTMEVDGKEIMAKKVQKRSIKKDGSYSDDNTYSINGVEKTLRDFNAYFEFDFSDLLMAMNVNAFLAQKSKEMREFLFRLPEDISDREIILRFPEFCDLMPLAEKYSVEEISAMNKASITKLNKELVGYPARIDEISRQIVDDVDTAELELKANALRDQIADIEREEEDSLAQGQKLSEMTNDIIELQFKKSDIERMANAELIDQRRELQRQIDEAESIIRQTINDLAMAGMERQRIERNALSKTEEKERLLTEWKSLSKATYPDFEELPEMNENDLICPVCGQSLPESIKAKKISEHEENCKIRRAQYENSKANWNSARLNKMEEIAVKGKTLRSEIDHIEQIEITEVDKSIKDIADKKADAEIIKNNASKALSEFRQTADLSDNQEYEALCLEISRKEEALRSMNTSAEYRAALKTKKRDLQTELDNTKSLIAKMSKNVELEERIEFLRTEQAQKEQSKANCEKILDLLEELEKKKNELAVENINSHFKKVTWMLWESAKNGGYKQTCIPTIDGYDLRNSANRARVLEAQIDIATSIQKIVGINAPIILDNAESIDSVNMERILNDIDCQTILLSVSDDKALRIEVA